MKERRGSERSVAERVMRREKRRVGGRREGSRGARWKRRANSRPCFTNCHLKRTNRGTSGWERGVQSPVPGGPGMDSPPRRGVTVAWANTEAVKTQSCVQISAAWWECWSLWRWIDASSISALFSCLAAKPRVRQGRKKRHNEQRRCWRTLCTLLLLCVWVHNDANTKKPFSFIFPIKRQKLGSSYRPPGKEQDTF